MNTPILLVVDGGAGISFDLQMEAGAELFYLVTVLVYFIVDCCKFKVHYQPISKWLPPKNCNHLIPTKAF